MHEAREGESSSRGYRQLAAGLCILLASVGASVPAPAREADPPTSAMAIDANTGAVLHNKAGDALRYPASLTKMMTLYMTFELIELGRLDYQSKIKMTEEGAAAAPTKLDLQPGEEITVLDAIKALVTKSANDVAIALGQHIGGTEQNFARLMTQKAHAIGMSHTVFKNASGLPEPDQVTTARDILTLALRLQDEFPNEYKLFATRIFRYGGHVYRNHNGLLTRYRGTDGIKTGYTRASGFNLVASVRRGGKHVIAAVFGGRTARARNARMRAILDDALEHASRKVTRTPAVFARAPARVPAPQPARTIARATTESQQPSRPQAALAPPSAAAGADPGPAIAVAKVHAVPFGQDLRQTSATGPTASDAQPVFATVGTSRPTLPRFAPGLPPSTLQAQAEALGAAPRQEPAATSDVEPAARDTPAAAGPFAIQIGAYSDSGDAEEHMQAARRRANGLLNSYYAVAVPVQKGRSQLYRARFRGFTATAAASTCLHLRRMQIDCFVAKTE